MRIYNTNGSTDVTCQCGSWLQHWLYYGGETLPDICPEADCFEPPEVGARVQKDSRPDGPWFIIPLCRKHNALTGESLEVSDYIALASADVNDTCGR